MTARPFQVLAAGALTLALVAGAGVLRADEAVDWTMIGKIRDEGFHRSQVMKTLAHLTDTIGPRLTGSPQMKQANDWTRQQLEEWGLKNAHLESFDFGRGWSFTRASVQMIAPHEVPLLALPEAWTQGTEGPVRGEVIKVKIGSKDDFEQYRGKLEGKILLLEDPGDGHGPPGRPSPDDPTRRLTAQDLEEMGSFEIPSERAGEWRKRYQKRRELRKAIAEFLIEEKALATLSKSSRDNGIVRVAAGGSREVDDPKAITGLMLSAEHFQRIERFLDDDQKVELEIDVAARFHEDSTEAYNTVAEIPGGDLKDQVVMCGAHLDSWHAGTGATDNGAGSAVMMEAVRILKALGVKPRRTIRIGLWAGEEQGLLGSRAYVKEHFASRPEPPEGEDANPFEERWPLTVKPEHAKLSVYFNLDNGSGKVRGVYAQENSGVVPIFRAWLEPFADLGADTVTQRNTGGTDHQAFDAVGLPGFQMIQDPLDYFSKTHHTNLDVLDLVEADDLKQASVILASFLYDAAMRDQMMPRKPLPQEPPKPKQADPKKTADPEAANQDGGADHGDAHH
ncbi:MAG: M20/M25/M40 family metallo-hydrolase [Acidobacteria bacterium]|nr:M20/M25/M40 family metallo-hydrolase [Acidobacteriota bacterium]